MPRFFFALLVAPALLASLHAQEKTSPAKLKVLFVTGGGYHDYKALNPVITKKVAELAHVAFDVKWGLDTLKDPKFADGYDAVLYNFCFGDEKDKDLIENALKVTRTGKPTIMVHCAMHSFRASDDWTDCCGMRTRVHDPYRAFAVIKADKEHPIVKTLADEWPTPGDELYQTIKLGERSKALLKGKAPKAAEEHVVAWVGSYGKGKVFATTLGHDLKTVNLPEYHRLLANGILWACDKLDKNGEPLKGYGPTALLAPDAVWTMRYDGKLDGQVDKDAGKVRWRMVVNNNRVTGSLADMKADDPKNHRLVGEVVAGDPPILQLRQDGPGGLVCYYTGKRVAEGRIVGTWFDNRGGSGDFEFVAEK